MRGFWARAVASPALMEWILKYVGPTALSAYLVMARSNIEEHHGIPYANKTFDFQNHPLVKKAGINLETDMGNKMLLANHRGRHWTLYLKAIKERLDNALAMMFKTGRSAKDCYNDVSQGIKRDIGNGSLKPYEREVTPVKER